MNLQLALVIILTSGFLVSAFDKLLQGDDAEFTTTRKFFEEGDNVVLNCTLKAKVTNYTAHELTFDTNRRVPLDPRSIRVLSNKTATMTLTNVTLAWNHKMVYCKHKSWWIQKFAFVYVGRRPLVPNMTECVLDDWQSLRCAWLPTRQAQVNHTTFHAYDDCVKNHHAPGECMNTTLLWTQDGSDNVTWHKCAPTQGDRCTVPVNSFTGLSPVGRVKVKVTVQNILGSSTSQVVDFDLSSIVRAAPVSQLIYTLSRGQAHVSWLLPQSGAVRALDVRLLWRCQYDKDTWTEVLLGSNVTSHLLLVEPYTHYDVAVDVRPTLGGLWSHRIVSSFTSLPTEPLHQPQVVAEAFQLLHNSKADHADVVFYWKPLTRRQHGGPDLEYVLLVRGGGQLTGLVPVSADITCKMVVGGQKVKDTSVEVVARNSVDYSNITALTITIPGSDTDIPGVPQYRLVAESWTAIRLDVLGHVTDDAMILRLFWCHNLVNDICQSVLHWSKPMSVSHSAVQHVPINYTHYSYGVSVTNSHQRTSGITWYRACVHDPHLVPLLPSNLHWSVDGRDNLTVTLTWEPPTCVGGATGLLTGYLVTMVTVNNNVTLDDTAINVTLPFTVTNHTLPQLTHPQFIVYVYALAVGGVSPPAIVQLNTAPYWRTADSVTVPVIVITCVLVILLSLVTFCIVRRCYRLRQWYKSGLNIDPPTKLASQDVSKMASHSGTAYRTGDLLSRSGQTRCHTQSCGGSDQSDDSGLDVKCSARDRGLESDVSLLTMSPMSPLLSHDDDVFSDLNLDPADLYLAPKVVYDVPRPQLQCDSIADYSVFFVNEKQVARDPVTYTLISDCESSAPDANDLHLSGISSGHSTDINSNTLSKDLSLLPDNKVDGNHGNNSQRVVSNHGNNSQSFEGNHGDNKVKVEDNHGDNNLKVDGYHGDSSLKVEGNYGDDSQRVGSYHSDNSLKVEGNHGNNKRVEERQLMAGGDDYVAWYDVPVFTPAR